MKQYIHPEMELVWFKNADIITTSGPNTGDGYTPGDNELPPIPVNWGNNG